MKAAMIQRNGGPEVFVYGDVPDPTADPGGVVVDIHAASVNAADRVTGLRMRRSAGKVRKCGKGGTADGAADHEQDHREERQTAPCRLLSDSLHTLASLLDCGCGLRFSSGGTDRAAIGDKLDTGRLLVVAHVHSGRNILYYRQESDPSAVRSPLFRPG